MEDTSDFARNDRATSAKISRIKTAPRLGEASRNFTRTIVQTCGTINTMNIIESPGHNVFLRLSD